MQTVQTQGTHHNNRNTIHVFSASTILDAKLCVIILFYISHLKDQMIYQIVAVVALCSALAQAGKVEGNSTLGICGYEATCSAGGYAGVCVSIGGGCCPGGTVTSGLCPG